MENEVECPACGSDLTVPTSLIVEGERVQRCQVCGATFRRVDGELLPDYDPAAGDTPDEYQYKYGADF